MSIRAGPFVLSRGRVSICGIRRSMADKSPRSSSDETTAARPKTAGKDRTGSG